MNNSSEAECKRDIEDFTDVLRLSSRWMFFMLYKDVDDTVWDDTEDTPKHETMRE